MEFVPRQAASTCVQCPSAIPAQCQPGCKENERCSVIFQTCDTCSTAVCIPTGEQPAASKGGANIGAIVGGVLAAVVLILIAIGVRWYRGQQARIAAAALKRATFEPKPDVVASADTVLNRPDPNINIIIEKAEDGTNPRHSRNTPDVSPIRFEPPENPFSDHASIATASDRATNVIPIGLITPSSASLASRTTGLTSGANSTNTPASIASSAPSGFTLHPPSESPRSFTFQTQQAPNAPIRPRRGPEIDMRLDPNRPLSTSESDMSHSTLLPPNRPYAASSRTGVSGVSSRSSMLSTSSSFLNEAPQIVTPKQANFRQVLGVQRAAVVQLGGSPGTSPRASTTPSLKSQQSTSTLGKSNPFGDGQSVTTDDEFYDDGRPMSAMSRPMSSMSNAESVANIASAQRVQFLRPLNIANNGAGAGEGRQLLPPSPLSSPSGVYSPTITGRSLAGSNASTPTATPRATDFRTAGQLTPPSQTVPRSFDDVMGVPPSFDDMGRPSSIQSFAMTNRTSTADSILESFPFVPPSPISMLNAQPQSQFQQQQQYHLQAQNQGKTTGARGPSSLRMESTQDVAQGNKPGRMTLGLSTVSSASSGLGAFPFQFEGDGQTSARTHASTIGPSRLRHPQEADEDDDDSRTVGPESAIGHGDRASLDTLQLSSEFPLPMPSPGLGPSRR